MSITDQTQQATVAYLRRHFAVSGVPQLRLDAPGLDDGRWRKHARCGPWNDDAPDPEIFYPMHPDDDATYEAQGFCRGCPVRVHCDQYAEGTGQVGVWGGIYRRDDRRAAPLCRVAGCLRYRAPKRHFCEPHAAEFDATAAAVAAVDRHLTEEVVAA